MQFCGLSIMLQVPFTCISIKYSGSCLDSVTELDIQFFFLKEIPVLARQQINSINILQKMYEISQYSTIRWEIFKVNKTFLKL